MASIRNLYPKNIRARIRDYLWTRRAKHSILIAGLGRCGTTLIQQALVDQGWVSRKHHFAIDLDNTLFKKGVVYKTHSRPPLQLPEHVKVVYLFGSPRNIVLSAHNKGMGCERFIRKHYEHMQAPENLSDHHRIFEKDTLKLEEQFDSWLKPQSFEFISVRYETLFSPTTVSALQRYLEYPIALPAFQKRDSDWTSSAYFQGENDVYDSLERKVAEAPDVKVWAAE